MTKRHVSVAKDGMQMIQPNQVPMTAHAMAHRHFTLAANPLPYHLFVDE